MAVTSSEDTEGWDSVVSEVWVVFCACTVCVYTVTMGFMVITVTDLFWLKCRHEKSFHAHF